MRIPAMMAVAGAVVLCLRLAVASPAKFTTPPSAETGPSGTTIHFTVDRETDVAVYVEDAGGRVVRHLAAGVLGKNPPAPLKADSLEQSVVWDGKDDDGKPAAGGPFKIRVALGLKASWGGTAFSEHDGPNNLEAVWGLATGPDGRVYAINSRQQWLYWRQNSIHVFRRDGSYERTIKPFPANLAPERAAEFGAFVPPSGSLTPIVHDLLNVCFYPFEETGLNNNLRTQQFAVTPDARIIWATLQPGTYATESLPYLAMIDADGAPAEPSFQGEPLAESTYEKDRAKAVGFGRRPCFAVSSDGKSVYMVGFGRFKSIKGKGVVVPSTAVYRTTLPKRGKAEVIFGDPENAGNDDKHLDDAGGIAIDRRGNILVADTGNNRIIAVRESDGGFAGSLAVDAPNWLGVNSRTGEIYVHSGDSIIKFSGLKDGREVARIKLAPAKVRHPSHKPSFCFAVDAEADPAVLWFGRADTSNLADPLLRCEDRGQSFSEWISAAAYEGRIMRSLSADPMRREVLCLDTTAGAGRLLVLEESTGKVTRIPGAVSYGCTYRLGTAGQAFRMGCGGGGAGPDSIYQIGRDGKRIPFPATKDDPKLKGMLGNKPSGTTSWERDLGIDRQGNIYVKNRGPNYHGYMTVDKYSAEGKPLGTVLWCVTDGGLGPRIDPQGNIYMADIFKPVGKRIPAEFDGRLDSKRENLYTRLYGSLAKFTAKGGAIWFPLRGEKGTYAFEGEPKLDASLSKAAIGYIRRDNQFKDDASIQGAVWTYFGFSPVHDMGTYGSCHCTASDFDVDDFGRSFIPDQFRFRTTVLDTNGNVITHIGGYGNQDFCGPDSYVLDPAGKFYRPRKADDPKDMVSPFAKPEIAFAWIVGMAVTDRHLYVADSVNRRVLRVRLEYEQSQTVNLPGAVDR